MKTIKNVGCWLIAWLPHRSPSNCELSGRPAHHYRTQIEAGRAPKLCQAGFRCFSQFEEDGLILFIMAALDILEGVILDIGSADGTNSNCANLALNFGWRGTFIDGNEANVAWGRAFYEAHPDTRIYPPKFICRPTRSQVSRSTRAARSAASRRRSSANSNDEPPSSPSSATSRNTTAWAEITLPCPATPSTPCSPPPATTFAASSHG